MPRYLMTKCKSKTHDFNDLNEFRSRSHKCTCIQTCKKTTSEKFFLKGMIQSLKRLNTVYATLPDAASNYNAILEIQSTTHRLNKAEGFSRIFVSIVRRYYVNGEFWSKIPTFKSVRIDSSFSSKNNPVRVTLKLSNFSNIQ